MKLDAYKIMQERIAQRLGLFQYGKIMHTVNTVNVAADMEFQRLFNGYYRLRRDAAWRRTYYELFKTVKTNPPDFRDILTPLYRKTGQIEASFSSKMLATLDPGKPIWDSNVLHYLGLRLTGKNKEETLENVVTLYSSMTDWYARYLNTAEAKKCFQVFDTALPDYTWISKVKKVDFFLWSNH